MLLRMLMIGAALLGTTLLMPSSAAAHDAGDVFEECKNKLERLTAQRVNGNESAARRAVRKIEQLLREGKRDEARRVANRAVSRIERTSARSIDQIERLCRNCIRRLKRLEADELAERLAVLCRGSVERINRSKQAAIAAIRGAFGD